MKSKILAEWDVQLCSISTDIKRVLDILIINSKKCRINKTSQSYSLLKLLKFNEVRLLVISNEKVLVDSVSISQRLEGKHIISATYYPSINGNYDPITLAILTQSVIDQIYSRDFTNFVYQYTNSFKLNANSSDLSLIIGKVNFSELISINE